MQDEISVKKRLIELHLLAAKKRKSPQTSFIHHHPTALDAGVRDTIPLFENFCYVLGLFRSKTAEQILEGRGLLERLLAFEVGGNFPIYLHEYPQCKDRALSLELLPVFDGLLREFQQVLGQHLQDLLENLILRILAYAKRVHLEKPLPDSVRIYYEAYLNPQSLFPIPLCKSPSECVQYLIALQMAESRGGDPSLAIKKIQKMWDIDRSVFLGPQLQEKGEPEVTLLDLFFAKGPTFFSARALKDHPIHLRASLVQPIELKGEPKGGSLHLITQDPAQGYLLFWKDGEITHSLACDHRGSLLQAHLQEGEGELIITLPETESFSEHPEFPLHFFISDKESPLLINSKKATTFREGDLVEIGPIAFRFPPGRCAP
ncbi:MAG: hypothetical protein HYZ48_04600 [Chlamydiales bacterium]|nr:hypothetical protein [Chlamydiales bacterium]